MTVKQTEVYKVRPFYGGLAQLVERVTGSHEVDGSNPLSSTTFIQSTQEWVLFLYPLGMSQSALIRNDGIIQDFPSLRKTREPKSPAFACSSLASQVRIFGGRAGASDGRWQKKPHDPEIMRIKMVLEVGVEPTRDLTPTRPSTLRVYQFRHPSAFLKLVEQDSWASEVVQVVK